MPRQLTTIPEFVLEQLAVRPETVAITHWDPFTQAWRNRTWREFVNDVGTFASDLLPIVSAGDRVVTLSENRYEWLLADLAIQVCGAVHVPLHPHLSTEQTTHLVKHCEPGLIIVSDQVQMTKLSEWHRGQENLIRSFERVSGVVEVLNCKPKNAEDMSQLVFDLAHRNVVPSSLLSILYTSGTMGEPKGVMLTQANVVSNAHAKIMTLPLTPADVRLCWLPMTHIFARVCDLYTGYLAGCHSIISRGREFLFQEMQAFRPTYLNGVPYLYDKCFRLLESQNVLDSSDALRDLLGGRMKLCNCGGAPLADHVFDFFRNHGIELVTGYGLTETSPVLTSNRPGAVRRKSVGQAVPGVELRISADGEVQAKGPNVFPGYYRDPIATSDAFADGWFSTGDLGLLDDDGFLFLVGRKKEIIVTSGGKNIAPVFIENLLLRDSWIQQVVVIGDNRNFLTALVVLNQEELGKSGFGKDLDPGNLTSIELQLKKRIESSLSQLSRHEQVKDFRILPGPFTLDDGTMTAKGSLRRLQIQQKYSSLIEEMYVARNIPSIPQNNAAC